MNLKNIVINAYRYEEVITTDITQTLSWDYWVLVNSSHDNPDIGGIWTFTFWGTYWFEYSNGLIYRKSWEHVDETTINYGPYGGPMVGTATITEISTNSLRMDDTYGAFYIFER